jgi:hypothetical protein
MEGNTEICVVSLSCGQAVQRREVLSVEGVSMTPSGKKGTEFAQVLAVGLKSRCRRVWRRNWKIWISTG